MANWRGTPRTWTAGEYVRDYWMRKEVSDRLRSLRSMLDYAVLVQTTEDQTTPTGETTAIAWDAAISQVGDTPIWTQGTDFTLPIDGYWEVRAVTIWLPSAGDVRRLGYSLNGKKRFRSSTLGLGGGNTLTLNFKDIIAASAGDIVQIIVWQNTGDDMTITAGSEGLSTTRAAVRLVGVV